MVVAYWIIDIVSPSPIPFPLDFGFWILDLDFGLGFGTGLGLDNISAPLSHFRRDLAVCLV